MSKYLYTANTINTNLLSSRDYGVRHVEDYYSPQTEYDIALTDVLWPRSTGMDKGLLFGTCNCYLPQAGWFEWPRSDSGSRSSLAIQGITKDQNGSPLANCLVKAYTTADNVLQGQTVSGSDGSFSCPTFSSDTHYLVASNTGVAGSSNTDLSGL